MEIQHCVRCGRGLKAPQGINTTGDRAIAVFISALTVGIRPRLKSRAQRQVFCMPCAASIALGPAPESGAFNFAVYGILCHLNSMGRIMVESAWEETNTPRLQLKRLPGSKPDVGPDRTLEAPVTKQQPEILRAAG
jgi:hypothetical protein